MIHDASGAVVGAPEQAFQTAVKIALDAPLPSAGSGADLVAPIIKAEEGPPTRWIQSITVDREDSALVRSPFGLIEDLLAENPWQLLIACMLLNKTGRILVDRLLGTIFERWPSPESLR